MSRVALVILSVLLVVLAVGCASDRHSQRRIGLRQQNFDGTVRSFQRREDSGQGRVERAQRAVEAWWRADEIEFADGLERVGDYAW